MRSLKKLDNRRKYILAIILTFMLVTVSHIANYAGSFEPDHFGWIGWPYAIAVEVSIIICAYFTKWVTTRRCAWTGYIIFVVASGLMNAGHIQPTGPIAWSYALFPTVAIGLLGFLYRQVDKLVQPKERPAETKRKPMVKMPPLPVGLERIPEDLADFRLMVSNQEAIPGKLTGAILAEAAGVTERTGRNWLADVRNGKE